MKLSDKTREAVEKIRDEKYKIILKAFIDFMEEEQKQQQFVDDMDVINIYLTDIYSSDLLAASLEYYYSNLSAQIVDGCLTITDSQIKFIDIFINSLNNIKNELRHVRETGDTEQIQEFLSREDRHYKSYCEKYGYDHDKEEEN